MALVFGPTFDAQARIPCFRRAPEAGEPGGGLPSPRVRGRRSPVPTDPSFREVTTAPMECAGLNRSTRRALVAVTFTATGSTSSRRHRAISPASTDDLASGATSGSRSNVDHTTSAYILAGKNATSGLRRAVGILIGLVDGPGDGSRGRFDGCRRNCPARVFTGSVHTPPRPLSRSLVPVHD